MEVVEHETCKEAKGEHNNQEMEVDLEKPNAQKTIDVDKQGASGLKEIDMQNKSECTDWAKKILAFDLGFTPTPPYVNIDVDKQDVSNQESLLVFLPNDALSLDSRLTPTPTDVNLDTDTEKGFKIVRVVIESLYPGITVHVGVINMWSQSEKTLEEKNKVKALSYFIEDMKMVMKSAKVDKISNIDMAKSHYYLVVFNLKTPKIEILDNTKTEIEVDLDERYGESFKKLEGGVYKKHIEMSRDVLTVGSTMRIPLLYRGEYSQWVERFMKYLEEQTDGEAMINSIKNGDQPLPCVTQVSIAGTTSTEQPPLKDKSIWITHHYAKQLIADPFIPTLNMKTSIREKFLINASLGQWSTCRLDDEESESGHYYFKRIYVCFKGIKEGWIAGCRKVIGLDGCFLKHTCRGELLVAIGKDVNNQMYPIAWAVVKVESNEN
nr:hypothetical protein [Tanacetum cinerariifolium]